MNQTKNTFQNLKSPSPSTRVQDLKFHFTNRFRVMNLFFAPSLPSHSCILSQVFCLYMCMCVWYDSTKISSFAQSIKQSTKNRIVYSPARLQQFSIFNVLLKKHGQYTRAHTLSLSHSLQKISSLPAARVHTHPYTKTHQHASSHVHTHTNTYARIAGVLKLPVIQLFGAFFRILLRIYRIDI